MHFIASQRPLIDHALSLYYGNWVGLNSYFDGTQVYMVVARSFPSYVPAAAYENLLMLLDVGVLNISIREHMQYL